MENEKKSIVKDFVVIKIKRVAKGIELYVKSQQLEEFFSPGGVSGNTDQGEYYYPSLTSFRDNVVLNKIDKQELFYDWKLNLSFLRYVGIKDGKKIIMPGVYSRDNINNFVSKTKEIMREFYRQYIKPIDVELVITTREVE